MSRISLRALVEATPNVVQPNGAGWVVQFPIDGYQHVRSQQHGKRVATAWKNGIADHLKFGPGAGYRSFNNLANPERQAYKAARSLAAQAVNDLPETEEVES